MQSREPVLCRRDTNTRHVISTTGGRIDGLGPLA